MTIEETDIELPSFLSETVDAPPPVEQPAASDAPARDAQGRFAAPETPPAAAAPPVEPETPQPVEALDTPATAPPVEALTPPVLPPPVPLATYLDVRDRNKALEAENARLRAAQQTEEETRPDPESDPEGARQYDNNQVQRGLLVTHLNTSQTIAESQFGAERVEAALSWFHMQPQSRKDEIMAMRHPYGYSVQAAEREFLASLIKPDEFEEFKAWKAGKSPAPPAAPGTPPQAHNPSPPPVAAPARNNAPPPPGISGAPSAGGPAQPAAIDGEGTFQRMFAR